MNEISSINNLNSGKFTYILPKILNESNSKKEIMNALDAMFEWQGHELYYHCYKALDDELIIKWLHEIRLSEEEYEQLKAGCLLHDLGKLSIPLEILNSDKKLSNDDWVIIKKHVLYGYDIVKNWDVPAEVKTIVLCHHERWDGNGYMLHLTGKQNHYLARIMTIIDAYDVMKRGRKYQNKKNLNEIISIFNEGKGKQWDPELVESWVKILEKGGKLYERF